MDSFLLLVSLFLVICITYLIYKLNRAEKSKEVLSIGFIRELNELRQDNKKLYSLIEDEYKKYNLLKDSIPTLIKNNRQDAVETSRVVLKGRISEEFVPFLPDFPFKISDGKFFGSPLDFIWFNGLSEGLVTDIVFMDVKTGGAKLTTTQKQIKQAIEEGKVSWQTYVRK